MKTRTLFLALLIGTSLIHAQPPPPRGAPGNGREFREGKGPQGPEVERRRQHVELWMERLEKEDPAEYERLNALRREDPAAFRLAVRDRLHLMRGRAVMGQHPRLREALQDLPEDQRLAVLRALGPAPDAETPEREGPPPPAFTGELRAAARALREAASDGQRQEREAELLRLLEAQFDARLAEREKKIARIREELDQVEKQTAWERENRERILSRQVEFIKQGGAARREPPPSDEKAL